MRSYRSRGIPSEMVASMPTFAVVGTTPGGVGAVMRVIGPGVAGPVRSVSAGSGYWSQDSAVQVLTVTGEPARLWVRWPGGRVTESLIPGGSSEVQVSVDGGIR